MNILKITILFALAGSVAIFAADGQVTLVSLEAAREQGRVKSRFLKETKAPVKTNDAIPKADVAYFQKSVMPILKKSCMNCHGPKKSEGRLRIDTLNPDLLAGPDVERWREIYNAVSNSEMPPADEPGYALANNDRASMVDWLSDELNKASLVRRNTKDHSSFRRLTKYEYDYALQDLLGLSYSLANRLPPESVTEDGFKNSSELLQISTMQFEAYRDIALRALKRATVSGDRRPEAVTYQISMRQELEKATAKKDSKEAVKGKKNAKTSKNQQQLLDQQTGESIPFPAVKFAPKPNAVAGQTPDVSPVVLLLPSSSELKLDLDRFLPDEGNMRVRVRVGRSTMNPEEFASLRLMLSAHTSNDANFSQVISQRDIPVTASAENPEFINFDVQLSDIQRNPFRKLTTTFPRRDEFLHIQNISNAFKGGEERLHLLIDYIEISAPYFEQWPPKTHTNIFIESANKGDEQVYGREVLTRFLRNVWRRPATSREVDQFMALFAKYRPGFSTFEDAMVEVLATALATPEFLYLTQRVSNDKSKSTTISELELASRLAVFLWSSIPDDELLKLAEQGRLRQPDVLSGQVKRMLADPRSRRFSQNFVEQWLGLDGLNSVTHIPPQLRDSIQEEPIAFFDEVLRQNRSIMDFIHSDYAVVNENLAAHYGLPKIYGPHFRKVPITAQSNRGGILTDAAMLAMNSDGKDSNPLKRGVWMLKRILHDPPPPPPPNVPEVDLTNPEILKMTLKERIVDHRNKAACISCHAKIDPWGIAFENYDALGIFRTSIKNKPVDATSELFNHQTLAGIDGVKRYLLLERQDQFARAMVHKLTAYALGRPLSFGDRADIDNLTAQLRRHDDKLGELIPLIINSNIFNSN